MTKVKNSKKENYEYKHFMCDAMQFSAESVPTLPSPVATAETEALPALAWIRWKTVN
jgi:hypothetical protein